MKKFLLAALFLVSFVALAQAQTALPIDTTPKYPILALERLHIGIRTEYAFWRGQDAIVLPSPDHEWGLGIAMAYAMVPRLSATARGVYFVDSKLYNYSLGLNFEIYSGSK